MRVITKKASIRVIEAPIKKKRAFLPHLQKYVFFALFSFLAVAPLASTNADYTTQKRVQGMNFESACWSAPSVPELLTPSNNSVVNYGSSWVKKPLFDWKNSEVGCPDTNIKYDIEVYLDPQLTTLLAAGSQLKTSQYLSSLSLDGDYYWRVRAKDQRGHISDFSEPWKVTITRSTLPKPEMKGWNLQSKSSTENKTPLDLVCGETTNGGNIDNALISAQWSSVTGDVVLYQLETTGPTGHTQDEYVAGQSYSNFAALAHYPELQGQWKSKVRAFIDTNGNRSFDTGEIASDWSNECSLQFDKEASDVPAVVMNEIFPSPLTADSAAKPDGEWVELYNRSSSSVDVNGWVLYDNDNGHALPITAENSDNNNNPFDFGETVVPANGYLVVYRNGDADFDLDNDGDRVRLFNGNIGNATLKDAYSYPSTPAGKSIARVSDGMNNWVDPVGTPGRKNVVNPQDLQPSINITQQDAHRLQLGIFDATNYTKAHVTVEYSRKQDDQLVEEELTKDLDINSSNTFVRDVYLGTISNGVEYPHFGIDKVHGEVVFSGENIPDRTLSVDLEKGWSEQQ